MRHDASLVSPQDQRLGNRVGNRRPAEMTDPLPLGRLELRQATYCLGDSLAKPVCPKAGVLARNDNLASEGKVVTIMRSSA